MKPITYYGKQKSAQLTVEDFDRDHLRISVSGIPVLLTVVQVDKIRQQFHGWLHERALGPDGENWREG